MLEQFKLEYQFAIGQSEIGPIHRKYRRPSNVWPNQTLSGLDVVAVNCKMELHFSLPGTIVIRKLANCQYEYGTSASRPLQR